MNIFSNVIGHALRRPVTSRSPLRTLWRIVHWQVLSRTQSGTHDIAWIEGANVIAIEPHPRIADRLETNVSRDASASKVLVYRAALSDAAGTGELTAGRDTTNQLTDAGENTIAVNLTTLDPVLEGRDPAMLKIDVEGHEPAVFAGAAATLAKPSLCAIEIETVDPAIRRSGDHRTTGQRRVRRALP